MPELVLLSFPRREFNQVFKRALRGDEEAVKNMETLWDGYDQIPCFLCDALVPRPEIFTEMLPDRDYAKLIAAPLCNQCGRSLTKMQRLHRCTKLLRKMWGGNVHFNFRPRWG